MISALGKAKNGMRPGGTCPARAELRAAVRAISEPMIGDRYCARCDYVIGPGICTSRSKVGDEASVRFMVGKNIGADARGKKWL